MSTKLGAAPNLIKTSVTTEVLILTSDIIATNTVKLKIIKMEFYFGNFLSLFRFLGKLFL